jgi:DNA-binding HxlR family transcriptional regulator
VPPRVDYELTELGKTLLEPIVGVAAWARANRTKIAEARIIYDNATDRETKPGVVTRTATA